MINGMFNGGAIQTLSRVVEFTEARHKVMAHNIANISNPYFKPADLSPEVFQATLQRAIDERRHSPNADSAPLNMYDGEDLRFSGDRLSGVARPVNEGILFHDQNNRDVERLMQRLAENTLTHNASVEMLRREYTVLETAIRGRL